VFDVNKYPPKTLPKVPRFDEGSRPRTGSRTRRRRPRRGVASAVNAVTINLHVSAMKYLLIGKTQMTWYSEISSQIFSIPTGTALARLTNFCEFTSKPSRVIAQNTPDVAIQFSLKIKIERPNIIIIITCSFVIVFIAFNHLYLAVIRTWRALLPRVDFLLIVTQRDLTIAQLGLIRRKQKHTFLYHCLLLCDCSRALIRAQEYISLSFFPNDKKCAGSVQFCRKCAGSVFFSLFLGS